MKSVVTREKTFTAGGAIGAHLRVKLSAGVLAACDATDVGIGVLRDAAFASGDIKAVELWNMQGTVNCVASAAITQFAMIYGAASGKVSASSNANVVGFAMEAASGNNSIIEVLPLLGPIDVAVGEVYSTVADSAEHENTTDAAAFDELVTIPANTLVAGSVLKVRGQVFVVDNNSTDTLTLELRIGNTVVIATAAVDVADNDVGYFDCDIVIRTIGASGTFVAMGTQALGVPGTVTAKPFGKAETAIDTTVDLDIEVWADWSVAHADNEALLRCLTVQHLHPTS